jgi:group I intron endonuclease
MAQSRYSHGKVYKLVNSVDDKIYIGSTCLPLPKRLYDHKQKARKTILPCHRHFNEIGWNNVRIVLIENVTAETKDQLTMREQHYIDILKPELNKQAEYTNCPHIRRHDKCTHGKRTSRCVTCGGNGLCIHNKQKPSCTTCKGSQVCIHSKRKQACKICNGDLYKCHTCDIICCSKVSLTGHNGSQNHKLKVAAAVVQE